MSNLPTNISNLTTAIDKVLSRPDMQQMDGRAYLKLDRSGFWIYGQDSVEVEEGSLWAVNPGSFALGYIAWSDSGSPLGEEMAPITNDPIVEADLPNVGAKWEQQIAMQLTCVSGEDKGTEVIYKASSKGGRQGFNDLLRAVMSTLQANQGTDKVIPIVELLTSSYQHPKKSYGTIHKPVFQIKRWEAMSTTLDTVEEPVKEEPVEEPVKEEPVKEEPTSKRRRRRA